MEERNILIRGTGGEILLSFCQLLVLILQPIGIFHISPLSMKPSLQILKFNLFFKTSSPYEGSCVP